MANVELFVPFVIRFEAGVTCEGLSNEGLFERARKRAFANDPSDRGGATMCGVTLAAYTEYCEGRNRPTPTVGDLRRIGYADWMGVLKTMYWDRWKADGIKSQKVAEMLVDWVWCSGSYGVRLPQKVLGVRVDGLVGKETLSAVNSQDAAVLLAKLKVERIAYINRICKSRPANEKFKKGWLNRIKSIG